MRAAKTIAILYGLCQRSARSITDINQTLSKASPNGLRVPRVLSLAQSYFADMRSFRRTARRLLILAVGDVPSGIRPSAEQNLRFEVARVISWDPSGRDEELASLLSPDRLRRDGIWGIVVSSECRNLLPALILLKCKLNGIHTFDEKSFTEHQLHRVEVDGSDLNWLWSSQGFRWNRLSQFRKRLWDLLIALAVLIAASPLMLIIALLIKLDSRGPVLYRQERVGLKDRVFTLYKFRSMRLDAEVGGVPKWAAVEDPRVTRVGKFIRYTRIDELPQLVNVLGGDMSIIGPRPERPYFVERLAQAIPLYSARHYVKPGITGWAQINAPYGASIDEARHKLRYDLYYIKHCSLFLDLLILLRTIRVVLLREGAR